MTETLNPDFAPVSELVVRIIQAGALETSHLANELMESFKSQAERTKAELDVVRTQIHDLLSGSYMPTSDALRDALYPSSYAINQVLKSKDVN